MPNASTGVGAEMLAELGVGETHAVTDCHAGREVGDLS